MNKSYLIYDPATGAIVETGVCQFTNEWVRQPPPGHIIVENVWDARSGTHYWRMDRPVPMSDLEAAITMSRVGDTVTFSGIPAGTTVTTYGVGLRTSVVVDDGVLEYETDQIGTHYFAFDHPRFVGWHDVKMEVE